MKLNFKSANQNKNNFRFTIPTKHVNNQTNFCTALRKSFKKCVSFSYLLSLSSITPPGQKTQGKLEQKEDNCFVSKKIDKN